MAFVDELHLNLKAGHGGEGVVRWLHLKGKDLSGPAGGNGGRGGNVYAEAVRDLTALGNYVHEKKYKAGDGGTGGSNSKEGGNGDDFTISVPVGSIITNKETGEEFELLEENQREMLLKGGAGGYGNEHFKGSQNTSPEQSTEGKEGEAANFYIELQLVVDAGFVGLPNAGKSSLLNVLTGAHAKVGDYAFTTLNPNLGVLYGYTLADIPGLIEGASSGKGLGHTFLRHIKRTKMIIHCVSYDETDPVKAYATIRNELAQYSPVLAEKQELLVCTKSDVLSEDERKTKRAEIASAAGVPVSEVHEVSIYDDASLKALGEQITQALKSI